MLWQPGVKTLHHSVFHHKNGIWLEGLGHGGFYSLNYERQLWTKNKSVTLARVGSAWYPEKMTAYKLWVPVSIHHLLVKRHHAWELGIAQIITTIPNVTDDIDAVKTRLHSGFTLGYRYAPGPGRIAFKAAFTPLIEYRRTKSVLHTSGVIETKTGAGFLPWISAGVGIRF